MDNLGKLTRVIFYYAGHGFYVNSENCLTWWDTHAFKSQGTTVSLRELLLDPLEKTSCKQALIFLDCCASNFLDQFPSRDFLPDFNSTDFDKFLQISEYYAIFMSCSPGQKSYPSNDLKHGIWTYHLIEALKGNAPDAITRDFYITDNSLQNYLAQAVPSFIACSMSPQREQDPFAKVSASKEFQIPN